MHIETIFNYYIRIHCYGWSGFERMLPQQKHVNFLTVIAKKNKTDKSFILVSVIILVIKVIKTIFDNCYWNLKFFKLH